MQICSEADDEKINTRRKHCEASHQTDISFSFLIPFYRVSFSVSETKYLRVASSTSEIELRQMFTRIKIKKNKRFRTNRQTKQLK